MAPLQKLVFTPGAMFARNTVFVLPFLVHFLKLHPTSRYFVKKKKKKNIAGE